MKFDVISVQNNDFVIKSEYNEEFSLNMVFHGLKSNVRVGDVINMSANLVNAYYEEYSTHYVFGPLDSKYGRKIVTKKEVDCISITRNDKTIFLKRFFG